MGQVVEAASPARWLEDARREAWAAFKAAEPPAKTVEAWRRVDFNAWRLGLLTDANLPVLLGPEDAIPEPASLQDAAGVFLQNGNRRPASVVLDPGLAAKGVLLMSLEEAASRHPGLVEPHLNSLDAPPEYRKLEAANLAQFRGGAFLYVPKGLKVDKPFDLVFAHYQVHPYCFPRVLVVAGEGSEAAVVEGHLFEERKASNDARKLSSVAFSRLVAGEGARIRYFYEQSLSPDTSHFWRQRVDLARGATLEHASILLGGAVHKSELDVRLAGPGARSGLYGILFGSRSQLFDPRTVQWHQAARTSSDLLFRAALKGRARSIYTGLIRVEKEAQGTDAYQQNNNLLLSNEARADTTPVLEILTDEVRCKHGATVGPVNQEELFYLSSRGLAPEEAVRMLLLAFFEPILSRLPLQRLAERIPRLIERRLAA